MTTSPMKVAHLCLSNFYIDGVAYQENELVRAHLAAGHDVVVIASTENFDAERQLTYVEPGRYLGADGAPVIRLPYRRWLPHAVARKIRSYVGLKALLDEVDPSAIVFHSLAAWELLVVSRYKRDHPHVIVNVDSHEDFNNSARHRPGRLLHRYFYGPIVRRSRNITVPALCISIETMDFVMDMYGLRSDEVEFFPLGGTVVADDEYAEYRRAARTSGGFGDDDIVLVQSGKFVPGKRLMQTLRAFSTVDDPCLRLVIAGTIPPEDEDAFMLLIEADARISFLGWQSAEKLKQLLYAADVYLQPGTQSVTMQASLCARCPIVVDDVPSHGPFVRGNGWFAHDEETIAAVLHEIVDDPDRLVTMSTISAEVAAELLDYRKLAERALTDRQPEVGHS